MANKPKAKGRAGEHEVARLVGGKRTPLSGGIAGDADIVLPTGSIWHDWKIEVKRRKKIGGVSLQDALLQADATIGIGGNQKPMVFAREDHGEWYIFVRANDLIQWAEALAEVGLSGRVRVLATKIITDAREIREIV